MRVHRLLLFLLRRPNKLHPAIFLQRQPEHSDAAPNNDGSRRGLLSRAVFAVGLVFAALFEEYL
jgi:hypothetical protein